MKGERATWRRRVGSYRILFDVHAKQAIVDVLEIVRRSSTTY
jgi:mRNA-degrading endonuclease RelE of RelBE toxin-antitoxin system